MSLSSPGISRALNSTINKAFERGVLSVVAAGNQGKPACSRTPAHVESAITVGSVDKFDRMSDHKDDPSTSLLIEPTWGSNYGPCVDIFAGGSDVVSARSDSNIGWTVKSGTSMATPAVAGAAALVLQANPTLSPGEVTRILKEYA